MEVLSRLVSTAMFLDPSVMRRECSAIAVLGSAFDNAVRSRDPLLNILAHD